MSLDLKVLEKTMKLMKKHRINKFQCEEFTIELTPAPIIKKVRKPYTRKEDVLKSKEESDQEFLDNHTVPPLDNEPWMNLDESVINNYILTGKN